MVRHSLNFVGWKLRKAGGATGRALRRSLNIRRGLESDLHHQCDRDAEHELAEDYQEPGLVPVR